MSSYFFVEVFAFPPSLSALLRDFRMGVIVELETQDASLGDAFLVFAGVVCHLDLVLSSWRRRKRIILQPWCFKL